MIQNADINVGPGHYKNLKPDELLVTNIWYTIQGEGPFAGEPAIFIRLAGCNRGRKEGMGCEFCDTKFHFDQGFVLSFNDICVKMGLLLLQKDAQGQPIIRPSLPLVVITGGEPMMQDNLPVFIQQIAMRGYSRIQIESNGDRLIPEIAQMGRPVTLVISPKTTNGKYRPLKQEVLDRADALKFVIDSFYRSSYYDVPDYAHAIPRKVYLSPLAVYREAVPVGMVASAWDHSLIDPDCTRANYNYAASLCMKYGFRLSIQSHLFASVP